VKLIVGRQDVDAVLVDVVDCDEVVGVMVVLVLLDIFELVVGLEELEVVGPVVLALVVV